MANTFGERKHLENEYRKWLEEDPRRSDCIFNVITFLEIIGRLKSPEEDITPCADKIEIQHWTTT